MKHKLKPILLALAMVLANAQPAFAAEAREIKVTCDVASGYEVSLPKTITVDGSGKTSDFTVSATELNLEAGQTLNIEADETFTMSQEGKADTAVRVKKRKAALHDGTYPLTPGEEKLESNMVVDARGLGAGSWSGAFNFDISVNNFVKLGLALEDPTMSLNPYWSGIVKTSQNRSCSLNTFAGVGIDLQNLTDYFQLSDQNRQLLKKSLTNAKVVVKGSMALGYSQEDAKEKDWAVTNTYKTNKAFAGSEYSFAKGDLLTAPTLDVGASTDSVDLDNLSVDDIDGICDELSYRAGIRISGIVDNVYEEDVTNFYSVQFYRSDDVSAEDAINGNMYNPILDYSEHIDAIDEWMNNDDFRNTYGYDNENHKYFESYGTPTMADVPDTTLTLYNVVSRDTTEVIIPTDAFEDISIVLHHFAILEGDELTTKWITVLKTGETVLDIKEN